MQFRQNNFRIRTQLLGLLMIVSLFLVACDAIPTPESEEATFEGAPEVFISSPLNGDTYREGVGVNILLRIDNAGPDIARVAIQVDGEIIGEATLPNQGGDASFTVSNGWPATGEGTHTISAVASRGDGTVSERASVTINVVAAEVADDMDDEDDNSDDASESDDEEANDESSETDETDESDTVKTEEPTDIPLPTNDTSAQEQATQAPAATDVPASPVPPTAVPATATSSVPQIRVTTGANVRSGPGQIFDPPIGSLAAGATANILAVNTTNTWYKIQFYNGQAWISASVVTVTGNISGLPREAGPPTPVPPTAVPPTQTPLPASNVDLIIDEAQSSFVPSFVCAQASQVTVTVVNQGTEASAGVTILIEDVQPDGTVGASTQTVVGALQPNQSQTATAALTVSTFIDEAHTFRVRVDSGNVVAESNENNNVWDEIYILEPGGC